MAYANQQILHPLSTHRSYLAKQILGIDTIIIPTFESMISCVSPLRMVALKIIEVLIRTTNVKSIFLKKFTWIPHSIRIKKSLICCAIVQRLNSNLRLSVKWRAMKAPDHHKCWTECTSFLSVCHSTPYLFCNVFTIFCQSNFCGPTSVPLVYFGPIIN